MGQGHHHSGIFGTRSELVFAILSGVALTIGWVLDTFIEIDRLIPLCFYFGAYFFGGWFTIAEAIEKIRSGKFEIDFLNFVTTGF